MTLSPAFANVKQEWTRVARKRPYVRNAPRGAGAARGTRHATRLPVRRNAPSSPRERDRHEHLAAARGTRRRPRPPRPARRHRRTPAAGARGAPASAGSGRASGGGRPSSGRGARPSRRVGGCPGRRARGTERVALVDVRDPGEVSFSSVMAERVAVAALRQPLRVCAEARRRRAVRPRRPSRLPPTRAAGRSTSCSPSPRAAPSRGYSSSRSASSGHAPTTVCRIRYASFGSRHPSSRGRTSASHSAGPAAMHGEPRAARRRSASCRGSRSRACHPEAAPGSRHGSRADGEA